MEFIRKSWAQIRLMFAGLGPAERWLLTMVVVVMVLVGGMVLYFYVAAAETVAITNFAPDRQAEAVQRLKAAGIDVRVSSGQLLVPKSQQMDALVALQTGDLMTADASAAFDKLIAQQNPFMTTQQNQQAFLIAKQKYLSAVIGKMVGVRQADVMLAVPEDRGFGRNTVRPSASVNVVMDASRSIDRPMVQAIAGLVSSAVAGMKREDVNVIDALRGRSYTAKDDADSVPSDVIEMVQHLEEYKQAQIMDVLRYIPGVIVAVNVVTDPTRSRETRTVDYMPNEPLVKERSSDTNSTTTSDGGGAPGTRSNVGVDIAAAQGGAGNASKTTTSETDYGPKLPIKEVNSTETGYGVQQVNVTVNVPRSYFVRLYRDSKGSAAAPANGAGGDAGTAAGAAPAPAEPGDADLQPIVQAQLTQIESQVAPLITGQGQGVVKAHMVPDMAGMVMASIGGGTAGAAGAGTAASGVTAVLGSDWIKPLGVGVLALVSLAIMFGMVKKATQAPAMPTVEELAGVPPTLPAEEDLVGEADETAPSLAGVELDEEELRHRRIAEQIGDMIRGNPGEAAQLVRRWVRTED